MAALTRRNRIALLQKEADASKAYICHYRHVVIELRAQGDERPFLALADACPRCRARIWHFGYRVMPEPDDIRHMIADTREWLELNSATTGATAKP